MKPFVYNAQAARVIFGSGTLARLPEEVERLGLTRVLVLATPQQAVQAEDIARQLGARAAGIHAGAVMHTPVDVTEAALKVVEGLNADGLVAVGGGSTTGLAKAIALRTDLPQIVAPSTFAGSEMTPILGETKNGEGPDEMKANMEARKENTPRAAVQREKLRKAIALKSYEFNAHRVEMNQRYASNAIISNATPEPEWKRDKELYYQATTWPGARLPHIWFEHEGRKVSSLDVVGKGRFTLLTGIGGETWAEAARAVARETGVEIKVFIVGPGRDLTDLYGEWADAREIEEGGCLLVRPDQHVAFRLATAAVNAEALLTDAMAQILGHKRTAQRLAALASL